MEEEEGEEGDREDGLLSFGRSTCTTLNCPFSLGACTYTVLLVLDPMKRDLSWNPIAEAKPSNFDFSGELSSDKSIYPRSVISCNILSLSYSLSSSISPSLSLPSNLPTLPCPPLSPIPSLSLSAVPTPLVFCVWMTGVRVGTGRSARRGGVKMGVIVGTGTGTAGTGTGTGGLITGFLPVFFGGVTGSVPVTGTVPVTGCAPVTEGDVGGEEGSTVGSTVGTWLVSACVGCAEGAELGGADGTTGDREGC